LGKLRQEDLEFQAGQGYKKLCLKIKKKRKEENKTEDA
jgi:hypothetical protein